jgi:hypothetical protein
MSHVIIAFKPDGTKKVVFTGTLEQAQAYQWSKRNAYNLTAQGYITWQLAPAKEH